jgi:hypothetical protein
MTTSALKKTVVAGSILGLALFALSKTKKGQRITKGLKDNLDDLYEDVGQKLQDLGDTTKEKYDEVVERLVREYSQKKMLAAEVAVDLTRELQKKWSTFQTYYLYGQVKSALRDGDEPTQIRFNSVANDTVAEYGKNKKLTKDEIAKLGEEVKKKWKEFKEEISQ